LLGLSKGLMDSVSFLNWAFERASQTHWSSKKTPVGFSLFDQAIWLCSCVFLNARLRAWVPLQFQRNFTRIFHFLQQWAATLHYTIWPLTVSVVAFLFPGNSVVLADAKPHYANC
jgi:hypothetical protein